MKYIFACAALAACVLLAGCASADSKPATDAQRGSELIAELVTGTHPQTPASDSEDDQPVEIIVEDVPDVDGAASQPVVEIPTAEVTTSADADNNFDIFYSEVYDQFALSEKEMSFVDHSLFVGDSICSGFSEYGIVSSDHVAAKGNLGSRSFFDYTFKFRGREDLTYEQVLKIARPRYVFLSMGMNDVNMVYEDTYCENYRKVIEATLNGSNAEVFVAAITPVCSKFCANSVIDSFNDTMRSYIEKEFPERVHFFDFGQYLKNEQGKLRTCLHSGDGVHLGPYCYYIALWEMHRALMEAGLWDGTAPIGTFEEEPPEDVIEPPASTKATPASSEPKETKPVSTTAKTTKTTKPKPAETTKTTKHADTTQPTEVPQPIQPTEQPQEIIAEPIPTEDTHTATAETPTAE